MQHNSNNPIYSLDHAHNIVRIIKENDMDGLNKYIEQQETVDILFYGDETPLTTAIIFDNKEMIQYLLNKGASIHIKNIWGLTPLCIASEKENFDLVKKLINMGASQINSSETPLHSVCRNYNVEIANYLLGTKEGQKSLNVFSSISNCQTPLMTLLYKKEESLKIKQIELIKLLLKQPDINVNFETRSGKTALMYLRNYLFGFQDLEEIISCFRESNPHSINHANSNGWTALMEAVSLCDINVTKVLLKNGANVFAIKRRKGIDGPNCKLGIQKDYKKSVFFYSKNNLSPIIYNLLVDHAIKVLDPLRLPNDIIRLIITYM